MTPTLTGSPGAPRWRWVVLGALLLGPAACSFERRPEPASRATTPATPPEEGVLAVATAFQEAVSRGDLASALTLFSSSARAAPFSPLGEGRGGTEWELPRTLLEGEGWDREMAGLDLLEASVEFPGTGTALVRSRYVDTGGEVVALETLLLVREGADWRIRHLHRSWHRAPP